MATTVPRKQKILCLHGYYQSGPIFHKKTGSFRKILASSCEFVYPTAPNPIPTSLRGETTEDTASTEDVFAWWFASEASFRTMKHYDGLDLSLNHIRQVFEQSGPFDGILGFSQGGVLASILCTMRSEFKFNFAIIVSAFPPTVNEFPTTLSHIDPDFPSLHIWGEGDSLIRPQWSADLARQFPQKNLKVMAHPGGHVVPTNSISKPVFRSFVAEMASILPK